MGAIGEVIPDVPELFSFVFCFKTVPFDRKFEIANFRERSLYGAESELFPIQLLLRK